LVLDKSIKLKSPANQNILVIGYNSYIGKEICKILIKSNYNVFTTVTKKTSIKKINKKLNLIHLDLTSDKTYKNINEDISVIINCACVSRKYFNDKKKLYSNNINGSKKLRKFCNKIQPKLLIYLSSMSVYGESNNGIVDHKSILNKTSIYGHSKHLEEKIFSYKNKKFSTIAIRLPGVLNKLSKYSLIPKICFKLKKNQQINVFNKDNLFNNLISSNELSIFILKILSHKTKKITHSSFPIGSKNPIKIELIVNYMKRLLNSKSKINYKTKKINYHYINNNYAINNYNYKPESTYGCIRNYINSI
jgi:nucleoside-diphosphate-sugar epimerase